MKLTAQQMAELLKKATAQDVEIVETEADSDYDMSGALTQIDNSRTPIIRQKIEAELTDTITLKNKAEITGRANAQIVKAFGVSRSSLDRAESIEEALNIAKAHYASTMEGDKAETERKYNEVVGQFNSEKEQLINEWQSKYDALKSEHETGKMIEYLSTHLKDMPTTWDKTVATKEVFNHAKSKYDVAFDEKGELVYYEKGTKRVALNAAANDHIKHIDLAKEYLEPRNGWAKDNRAATPATPVGNGQPAPKASPMLNKNNGDTHSTIQAQIEAARAAKENVA